MCGVGGFYNQFDVKMIAANSTLSGQHRGQNACGAAMLNVKQRKIEIVKGLGSVAEVFSSRDFREIDCKAVITHVRWPTAGANTKRNIQPHYTQGLRGRIAIASNGDIVNFQEQLDFLEKENVRVYSQNDAEVISAAIFWQIEKKGGDVFTAIANMMKHIRGAYSAVFMVDWEDAIYAFRDPNGFRPLLLGSLENRYMVVSESCMLEKVGARFIREVYPGEIIRINDQGITSVQGVDPVPRTFCTFEKLYFQRPDSVIYYNDEAGKLQWISNQQIRKNLGRELAAEHFIKVDMIIGSPRSGIPAGMGYAEATGLPYVEAIISEDKRTFTEAERNIRVQSASEKYHVIPDSVAGKSVVIVDDSQIKGLTMPILIRKLRDAGAIAVHVRIASPPYKNPCLYGVETKCTADLIAHDKTIEEIRRVVGCPDSLHYLSLAGFRKVMEACGQGNCYACLNGEYPVK